MTDVTIFEVGPRDGLQNEKQFVPTDIKVDLINRLVDAGINKIECTSFVSPKWVPQMADAMDVMSAIDRKDNVTYSALTPNERGMHAALEANVSEVAVFAAASESFSQKNINCSIEESLTRFDPVMKLAKENGLKVRGYVSCVTHCPYEGAIDPAMVKMVGEKLLEMGCYELSLGDTIGKAHPQDIQKLIETVTQTISIGNLALHLHDTYDRALENMQMGLDLGIRTFDSSVAGLGGCPYAEGASGNVSTEAAVHLIHENGFSTGVELAALHEVVEFISLTMNSLSD
ncbi:hydroxymethylglutaryl-CoA lyase [Pseudemcibacter aquimaris]|uniref:hydroxymethylglutaryl-CoA lyase n=1 Tax=Pseudemcibacter aquimaris TaxID=2857064 RepID=UPI002013609E|nr:hydroxymethylglutaryl-CoA lyase [Pseudemcibacter aquimaris]MCC3860292.1 hydroxymethylglutaryl-CoA lyase [Pseudemcibacter aquimaris]WDU57616.1 hydroxymethylglutaryl-CoA lyase [Pseudemcibacter aquimaris]